MHVSSSKLVLSPTDLAGFSECEHKTLLELAVAERKLDRLGKNELEQRMLERRGLEHERRVLAYFRDAGREVVSIPLSPSSDAEALASAARATVAAMQAGADVVYQGVLYDGAWLGRPDFLVKTPFATRFGEHGYEVLDAKLAREAKAAAVLQLCAYTDHLASLQRRQAAYFWIAPGRDDPTPIRLRADDYMALYRRTRRELERFTAGGRDAEPYPEPVEHCDVCPWWKRCDDRRRADDHLSLVAGITRRQRDRLVLAGVSRVSELALLSGSARVPGVGEDGLARIREQAALQLEGRGRDAPLYRLLPDFEPGHGLESLPLPKPGDLFLDLEGDPFVRGDGLEYLFGLLELGQPSQGFDVRNAPGEPRYQAFWATTRAEEKRAFEAVIDRIRLGLEEFANLHVFHFGHREADALKTLSCRHDTREDEVDDLLRRGVLVDLHRVVKQALRASVESYTLKELEGLYRFERKVELRRAAHAMQLFGWWLETGDDAGTLPELRASIERYNEDDCRSAWQLRDWLELRRSELEQSLGRPLARPAPPVVSAEKRERASEETARVAAALQAGLPEDPALDDDEQRPRRLLANLLDWHWREAKSSWWEYYRALELPRDERLEDRAVLGGLTFVEDREVVKKSRVQRYRFPEQEHRLREGDKVLDPETKKSTGEVVRLEGSHVDLKRNPTQPHPSALVLGGPPPTDHQRECLLEIGRAVAARGLGDDSECVAARRLLRRLPPVRDAASALIPAGVDSVDALSALALALDGAVLPVQGPPGSGKTHHAAHLVVALVRAGKRVGITANSHKVITSLIERALAVAAAERLAIRAVHASSDKNDGPAPLGYEVDADHARNAKRLRSGEIQLLGGTAWAWSRPEFRSSVDTLVVDEAGQVSLANALAVSLAAKNLILLGDPAQLDQPQKGVHPPGADVSALEHLLGDELTLSDRRGVFLAETRRLHPALCHFTSTVFYDGRLRAVAGLERQRVVGPGLFDGNGLRFVPVAHRGNTNRSDEEADIVEALLAKLFAAQPKFVDRNGATRSLSHEDVRVVAPYNAQVAALRRRLSPEIAVGTVDKFQGQEAPIVVYSMTSSSAEDAPRGMEFLYSLNRLNVATSRAQALVVLVASPELTKVRCQTPRQMRLANALCTYLELADVGV